MKSFLFYFLDHITNIALLIDLERDLALEISTNVQIFGQAIISKILLKRYLMSL